VCINEKVILDEEVILDEKEVILNEEEVSLDEEEVILDEEVHADADNQRRSEDETFSSDKHVES
jgi:hypothetical protein